MTAIIERAPVHSPNQTWPGDIDLQAERAISLSRASHLPQLRVNGRSPHINSLYRWIGPAGVRGCRLESVFVGGKIVTTEEAVTRFLARLSNPQQPTKPETPTQRLRRLSRAEGICEAAGI